MTQSAQMLEPIETAALAAIPGLAHGFFTRAGGVSTGLYGSLNCGIGSKDERSHVLENRARVARRLGTEPGQLLTCHQIHSATALLVTEPWPVEGQPKADGLVTKTPGLALAALAADCAPILFADPEARVIGTAHAGWKGALIGIAEATLATMETAGARRERTVAVVGPCISQAAYEVGPEFETAFTADHPDYACYFKVPPNGRGAHFDLPRFLADRLAAAGVGTVAVSGACTYGEPNRFFSYRRTTHAREADYGRQISAIMLL
jgi:YfiH family protein